MTTEAVNGKLEITEMHDFEINGAELAELSAAIVERGGSLSFQAHGSSMSPFIRDGDILTVEAVDPNQLAVADVVLYQSASGRIIAHRIVSVLDQTGGRLLQIRGDAATGATETVHLEQVLGRIVTARRRGRLLHLARPGPRLAALLWIRTAPLGPWLLRQVQQGKEAARQLLTTLQALRLYRRLAHALLGSRIRYRPATAGDLSALAWFYRHTHSPEMKDLLARLDRPHKGKGIILLATIGGRLAGAVGLSPCSAPDLEPGWCLQGLQVRSRYRGAGIGEQLVRLALAQAADQGALQLYLRVKEQSRATLALCIKAGFQPVHTPQAPADGPDREARLFVVATHAMCPARGSAGHMPGSGESTEP